MVFSLCVDHYGGVSWRFGQSTAGSRRLFAPVSFLPCATLRSIRCRSSSLLVRRPLDIFRHGSGVRSLRLRHLSFFSRPAIARTNGQTQRQEHPIEWMPMVRLVRRPLFPGCLSVLSIRDPALFDALVQMRRSRHKVEIAGFYLPLQRNVKGDSAAQSAEQQWATASSQDPSGEVNGLQQFLKVDAMPLRPGDPIPPAGTVLEVLTFAMIPGTRGGQAVVMPTSRVVRAKASKPADDNSPRVYFDWRKPLWNLRSFFVGPTLDTLKGSLVRGPVHRVEAATQEEEETLSTLASHTKEQALVLEAKQILHRLLAASSPVHKEILDARIVQLFNLEEPERIVDLLCGLSLASPDSLQILLEEPSLFERMRKIVEYSNRDLASVDLQNSLRHELEGKIADDHRRHLLVEQLHLIKRELGMDVDEREVVVNELMRRLESGTVRFPPEAAKEDKNYVKKVPAPIMEIIQNEMRRLRSIEKISPEFALARTYLEWLCSLPWGIRIETTEDIGKVEQSLIRDHHGLKDVRERILELHATTTLRFNRRKKMADSGPDNLSSAESLLCLVGPPGVGKTSVASSIANALGRQFYRISLGGVTDPAELRGHRRTYIGAIPGKIVTALRETGCENPVILLDEVDKMGRDHRGDPSMVLLEALDPVQNNSFRDHYLDAPVDLSHVLFLCTANSIDGIPEALLDRMEIINLPGYTHKEKTQIALKHLLPQVMDKAGFVPGDVDVSGDIITVLINNYCREAGVRSLLAALEKLFRRVALWSVQEKPPEADPTPLFTLTPAHVVQWLGPPLFHDSGRLARGVTPLSGTANALAWDRYGGSVLPVEVLGSKGEGFCVTGRLGEVMTESSQLAMAYVKSILEDIKRVMGEDGVRRHLDNLQIHLHVPEGSVPKDGPSAGSAIATALLSYALDLPARSDVAMTGELTLKGLIKCVGGIKTKVLAAKRSNIRYLILPTENLPEFELLEKDVREDLTVYFVSDVRDAMMIALGNQPPSDSKMDPLAVFATSRISSYLNATLPTWSESGHHEKEDRRQWKGKCFDDVTVVQCNGNTIDQGCHADSTKDSAFEVANPETLQPTPCDEFAVVSST